MLVEGQLLQMLAYLQKRPDVQEAEAACEREKVTLEGMPRSTSIINFSLKLRCSKEPRRGVQTWRNSTLIPRNHVQRILSALEAAGGITNRHPLVARNTSMRANLTSPLRLLTSRISWRWSGSGSMKISHSLVVGQDLPSCGSLISHFQRRSRPTGSQRSS